MLYNFVSEIHDVFNHPFEILIDALEFRVLGMTKAFGCYRPISIFQMPRQVGGKLRTTLNLSVKFQGRYVSRIL